MFTSERELLGRADLEAEVERYVVVVRPFVNAIFCS